MFCSELNIVKPSLWLGEYISAVYFHYRQKAELQCNVIRHMHAYIFGCGAEGLHLVLLVLLLLDLYNGL